jgi:hypothetical protein
MKEFSAKQVFILVLCIVAFIAFLETSSPTWTSEFWREFVLKLVAYGAASEIVVVILAGTKNFK